LSGELLLGLAQLQGAQGLFPKLVKLLEDNVPATFQPFLVGAEVQSADTRVGKGGIGGFHIV
jgi:hypothetical protein